MRARRITAASTAQLIFRGEVQFARAARNDVESLHIAIGQRDGAMESARWSAMIGDRGADPVRGDDEADAQTAGMRNFKKSTWVLARNRSAYNSVVRYDVGRNG
jgi:hypothetical protein